jgi:predicted DNA-binding transcriptional regulator AlpA
MRVLPINRPTTSLVHGLVSSVPHPSSKARPLASTDLHAMPGASPLHQAQIDPQMSPYMRVLSFGDLKCLKHIGWNEEYIAQLVGAGLFPAPIHPGGWRESQIDDWLKARKAKGDLSWMRFSLKDIAGPIARVGRSAGRRT